MNKASDDEINIHEMCDGDSELIETCNRLEELITLEQKPLYREMTVALEVPQNSGETITREEDPILNSTPGVPPNRAAIQIQNHAEMPSNFAIIDDEAAEMSSPTGKWQESKVSDM